MEECRLCYRHCRIPEGGYGFCGVRTCRNGVIFPENYGKITSIALDPIEKKPFARFHPGSFILSVGSYGCNLRCPFCQNYRISWSEEAWAMKQEAVYLAPEELARIAAEQVGNGNIGVAFTYNEPLISYEYVRDTARILRKNGLKTVLVTNGMASVEETAELLTLTDAMNIDLKGFTDSFYEDVLKGNRKMVMDFIREAVKHCHVELTTLVIPGENDSAEEIEALAAWIRSLDPAIPLHLTRFFPRFHMQDRDATPAETIFRLKETAEKYLDYVYVGNL